MLKKHTGLTLLELLLSLVLVMSLLTLAVPSFRTVRQQSQVRSAGMMVYSHIQLARSEAIKRNVDITLCFNDSGTSHWQYHISELTLASDCNSGVTHALLTLTAQQHPAVVLTMAYPDPYLIFKPRRSTLTSGNISVSQGDWAMKVITWNNNIIRTCSEHSLAGVPAC